MQNSITNLQPISSLSQADLTQLILQTAGTQTNGILQSEKGEPNGICPLDANGLVNIVFLPQAALSKVVTVTDEAARFALTTAQVQQGDIVIQTLPDNLAYFVKDETNLSNANGYATFRFIVHGNTVLYVNATSGLQAVNIQDAIDEIVVLLQAKASLDVNNYVVENVKAIKTILTEALVVNSQAIAQNDTLQAIVSKVKTQLDNLKADAIIQNKNGFENRTSSTLTLETRTFTIAPNPEYIIYVKGQQYKINTNYNVTIPNTIGLHYIYFDVVSGVLTLLSTLTQDKQLFTQWAYVANIYWNGSVAVLDIQDERHGIKMDGDTHFYLHTHNGTIFKNGLLVGVNVDGDGANNNQAQFSITSGLIADEDNNFTTLSKVFTDNTPILYRLGSVWQEESTNFIVKTGGSGRAVFNENIANSYQLTEITNNDFGICFVVAGTSDTSLKRVFVVMGNASYTTIALAREGASTPPDLSGLPFQEYKVIAGIIYQTSNTYTNAVKTRIRSIDASNNYIDWRYLSINGAGASGSDIANLQNQLEVETAARTSADNTLQTNINAKANDNAVVKLTGDQTIAGIKTFSSFPITPSSAPATAYQAANKQYADTKIAQSAITDVWNATSQALVASQKALHDALNSLSSYNAIYVNPTLGSDTTGTGTKAKPYQTIQKALNPSGTPTSSRTIYVKGSTTQNITFEATNTSIMLIFDAKSEHTGVINLVDGNTAIYFLSTSGQSTFLGTINDASKGSIYFDAILTGTYNKTGGSGTVAPSGYVEFASASNINNLVLNISGNSTIRTLGTGGMGQLTQSNGVFICQHKGTMYSPIITGGANPLLGQPICLLRGQIQLLQNGSNKSLSCNASYGLVYLDGVSTLQNDFSTYGQIDFTGAGINCALSIFNDTQLNPAAGDVFPVATFYPNNPVLGYAIAGAAAKTTLADADVIPLSDSANSNLLKKITGANLKAVLSSTITASNGVQKSGNNIQGVNATTLVKGVVQLSNSFAGTSQTLATTEKALSDGLVGKLDVASAYSGTLSIASFDTLSANVFTTVTTTLSLNAVPAWAKVVRFNAGLFARVSTTVYMLLSSTSPVQITLYRDLWDSTPNSPDTTRYLCKVSYALAPNTLSFNFRRIEDGNTSMTAIVGGSVVLSNFIFLP